MFFRVTKSMIQKLAFTLRVPGVDRTMSLARLLELLVRELLDPISDAEVYDILLMRAPMSVYFQELLETDEIEDMLNAEDRKHMEKAREKLGKAKSKKKEYLRELGPLRQRVQQQARAARAAGPVSDWRRNGPEHYADDTWTLNMIEEWMPPGVTVFEDHMQRRWQCRWTQGGNVSRAWRTYGKTARRCWYFAALGRPHITIAA